MTDYEFTLEVQIDANDDIEALLLSRSIGEAVFSDDCVIGVSGDPPVKLDAGA